jgi:O-antigen/teichoic acid export membrane protein
MILFDWIAAYRVRREAVARRLHGLARVFVGGFAAAVVGYAASSLLGTLVQALTVRRLGVEGFGEFTTLVATLSLLSIVLGFGLDTWLLKEGGHSPERLAQSVYQLLLLKLAGALVLVSALAVGWSNHAVYSPAFLAGVGWGVLGSFTLTGYAALRAARRNLQVALFQTLEPLLLLAVLLATTPANIDVLLLMLMRLGCGAVLFALVMQRVWTICGRPATRRIDPLPVVRGSWLFVAADALATVYSQAPVVILAANAPAADVGLFGATLNLILLLYTVPNLMFMVALPLLSAVDIRREEYTRLLKLMTLGAAVYGVAALSGLLLLGDWLLVGLYGQAYHAAQPYVLALCIAPLLKAVSFVFVAIMLSRDVVQVRVAAQVPALVLSLAASTLLIPAFGVAGAVASILALEIALFALYGLGAFWALRRGR